MGDVVDDIGVEDLKKFGMIPELLGRFPILAPLKELTKQDLVSILTEPKQALVKQYKQLYLMDNVDLEFEPLALEAIAEIALERKTGARGLRGVMEDFLSDLSYETPKDDTIHKIVITEDYIKSKSEEPLIIRKVG
jgi:ATP-dependent Clp protease ATP-binding subunit ClpX